MQPTPPSALQTFKTARLHSYHFLRKNALRERGADARRAHALIVTAGKPGGHFGAMDKNGRSDSHPR